MVNALPLATNLTVSCAVTFMYSVLASIGIVRIAPEGGTTWPRELPGVKALADRIKKLDVIVITVATTISVSHVLSVPEVLCAKSRYGSRSQAVTLENVRA